MYVQRNGRSWNPKSGKEIRDAFKAGDDLRIDPYGPFDTPDKTGPAVIEGPRYPAPHKFYIACELVGGKVTRLKK